MPSPKQLLKDLSFTIIDLETTGGNQNKDKIIEIGMTKVEKLKVTESRDFLVQPNIKIPEFIQKLTSITPNDVKDSEIFENIIDEVLEFIGDSIIVAHNTAFDVPFLNSELRRMGREPLTNKSICTNLMTKYLIPNILNSNLNYMSRLFNIEHKKAHRAIDDAKATAELLLIYLNIFIEKKINKVNHIYYPKNRYELDRHSMKKGEKGSLKFCEELQTPFLITIKGENGVVLLAYPSNNTTEDIAFITNFLKTVEWVNYTVRLYGDFLEAFINFLPHFQRKSVELKKDILTNLYQVHFNKLYSGPNNKLTLTKSLDQVSEKKQVGDFIVIPHLVPEQLVIYPIHLPHNKLQLTFRYPAHQKKLIQYINSKASRLDKHLKNRVPAQLEDFYFSYLNQRHATVGHTLMMFPKSLPLKSCDTFFAELDKFLTNNIQTYRYPKDYI